MTPKLWNFLPGVSDLQSKLSSELGISDILARLLVNRVGSHEKTASFLNPQLKDLCDPFLFRGMNTAVSLIKKALSQKKRFLIYGDYDVDGVTSTVLLLKFFKILKADVGYYIPNRVSEGYSFTKKGIEAVLERRADLLISVDNGVSAVNQIAYLREKGVDVIVTDHHEPPDELPPANVIIDPKQKDCPYPFKHLAGVGVAFKLAWAVAQALSRSRQRVNTEFRNFLLDALAWVALGTVTDLVPLIGENRLLAKYGIPAIHNSNNPGLQALCEISRNENLHLSAEDISFRIGPRINAAGRMGRVEKAVDLFLTPSHPEAVRLARELDLLNGDRQAIEREIFVDARQRAAESRDAVVLLADRAWHPGVIGIVASRIVEEFGKPAVLIAIEEGLGKGSCRSLPGLDIYKVLTGCTDLLEAYGGHALAGGFQIQEGKIDALRERILELASCNESLKNRKSVMNIDAEIYLSSVTRTLLSEIDMLRPFGEGNPVPLFVSSGLEVAAPPQAVGRDQSHLIFRVRQGSREFKAIAFGQASLKSDLERASRVAIAYTPQMNVFYGKAAIELHVKDIRAEA